MEKRKIVKGAVDDLVLLDDISEQGVVENLGNRFDQDLIYSYIGPVLVSVNPFKEIRGLYSRDLMKRYYGNYKYELAPHVYASAEEAYRQLLSTTKNQCILVSGESGAGKTEAAKKIMEYVTQVSDDRAEADANISVRDIKDALLQSNPVLEAFGNATTLRNDNSSRFGKYMVIQMDYNGVPIGGEITNYLLEKPRVVGQTAGERSFHVFYQLCAAGPRELQLGSAADFDYVKGTTKVRSIDDARDFQEMSSACDRVGVTGRDKQELFKLVAAVLHLGNIGFDKGRGDTCEVSRGSANALRTAADLLSVREGDLARALTHRTLQNSRESITSPLTTVDECVKTRDALAKALYSRNFQKLVQMINTTIHTDMAELSLGVLDIYGFEIFEHNSFEQLCINYANEKLQQLFIELTLKAEQEEYSREGIRWDHIDFFNNKIVCDLIESKRPAGIFAYLDEECIYPRGTDMTYLKKMESNLVRHPHYGSLATKTQRDPTEFLIRHYAGDVVYSVDQMLDKNKDTLFRDLIELIGRGSQSEYLNALFPEAREAHDMKKPITAGTAFVRDMQELIDTLEQCEPHYIRTIKSNDQKRGGIFNPELVKHQVRYLGLVENVRVRRAGFAYRQTYELFVLRYKMLSKQTWPRTSGRDKRDTETILRELGISDVEFGKTKVFLREPQSVFKLEDSREKALHSVVAVIQKAYRKFKARLYFLRLREESVALLHQNKRRRGSWALYFLGDYIFAQDNAEITAHLDARVKFADTVNVMDAKSRMVPHILVVTNRTMYLFSTAYKVLRVIPFRDIRSFGLSTYADGVMLIDFHAEKPVETLIMESMRKAEITTLLSEETQRGLPLKFSDSHQITVLKKSLFGKKYLPKTAVFQESSEGGLHGLATFRIVTNKQENPDAKTTLLINVSPLLGSKAQLQLDSPLPDRINRFKGRPTGKKKIPYGGYRRAPMS